MPRQTRARLPQADSANTSRSARRPRAPRSATRRTRSGHRGRRSRRRTWQRSLRDGTTKLQRSPRGCSLCRPNATPLAFGDGSHIAYIRASRKDARATRVPSSWVCRRWKRLPGLQRPDRRDESAEPAGGGVVGLLGNELDCDVWLRRPKRRRDVRAAVILDQRPPRAVRAVDVDKVELRLG